MDNSPFAKLPAELRNIIADFVMHSDEAINITDKKVQHASLALTQTCRRFRQDYMSFFYFINKFALYTTTSYYYLDVNNFSEWLGEFYTTLAGPVTVILTLPYHDCQYHVYHAADDFKNIAPVFDLIQHLEIRIIDRAGKMAVRFTIPSKEDALERLCKEIGNFVMTCSPPGLTRYRRKRIEEVVFELVPVYRRLKHRLTT